MSINVTKADLFNMILRLQEQMDLLVGRPRGPLSMTDLRLAAERGDKATIARYWAQFSKEELQGMNSTKGGPVKTSVLCGASAVNQNQL